MGRSVIRKKLDRRGFTIAEALMVVAVLAVLFALVAPDLVKIRRNLNITRLDGTAQEIFLTAQNEMTDRKASGQLNKLEEEGTISPVDEGSEDPVTRPLYYMTTETAEISMDQLTVFLSTVSGKCIIYLNPRSGDVTDVYYSENDLTYETVAQLREGLGGEDDREERADMGIGYYGGLKSMSAEPSEEEEEHLPDTLELVNGEDLYLNLFYPRLGQAFAYPEKIQTVITVKDEHSNTAVLTADGNSAADAATSAAAIYADVDTNNDYTLYVLLDSMNEGESFTELFPSLAAGDDITLTASLSYDGKIMYRDATVGSVNSLFAAKYTSDDSENYVLRRKGVEFSRVRHLSNLHYYNQNDISAVQIADIDFEPEVRKQTMLPVNRHLQELKEYFAPVDLNQSGLTIDGRDGGGGILHILRNFEINSPEAGLFGSCTSSVNLCNLRLLDFNVSGENYAGALIGRIHSSGKVLVDNCGAYQTEAGRGTVAAGGPAGTQAPAGGLIGAIDGIEGNEITVQKSFAALNVTNAAGQTGGLIGKVSGGSQASPVMVQNSYSSGTVISGSGGAYEQTAGGLVGITADTVTIAGSFSSSDVYGSAFCGALVGSSTGRLFIRDSYACGSVTTANNIHSAVTYGPLATASGNGSVVSYSDCRYLSQSGNGEIADAYGLSVPAGVTACEYDNLAADAMGNPVNNDPVHCHPYSDSLKGKAYPFPMVTDDYYGDWPLQIQAAAEVPYSFCYYEEYNDSSWGFYGYDKNEELADSLDYQNQKVILSAGYGILVPAGTAGVSAPDIGWGNKATMGEKNEIMAIGQDLYPLPNAVSELMTHNNQLDRGIRDHQSGRTIYLNPLFGAAMSKEVLKADASLPLQIRTEEQLRARNLISNSNWYFKQTHNITLAQSDTGSIDNITGCTYDGGGNTINNLQKPLFLRNLGTVKDLQLSEVSISESSEAAALVQLNQGLVSNCHVLSGRIASMDSNAAGLVANSNGGTITGCSVGTAGIPDRVAVAGSGTYTAGLVAVTGGSGLVISDCRVTNAEISNPSGSSAGLVGYNVANVSGCAVGRDVSISGSCAAGFAGTNTWGGLITGCSTAGALTSSQNSQGAAGMVWLNGGGTVTLSYSTSVVTAQNGGNASGFADTVAGGAVSFCYWNGTALADGSGSVAGFCRNLTQGSVSNSFAAGTAGAFNGEATGFVKNITQYNGSVFNCYSAVEVTASGSGSTTGFSKDIASCSDNYWVNQSGFNETVSQVHSQGRITSVTFEQLKVLSQLAVNWTWDSDAQSWTLNTSPEQTHPDNDGLKGQSYPYPRISGLEYYGDWPVG